MHEAKTNLSKLVDQVNQGEEVILARAGKPVARLVPVEQVKKPRTPGLFRDQGIHMSDDFDDLPPEILQAMIDPKIFP